jgi:hypothetical protein
MNVSLDEATVQGGIARAGRREGAHSFDEAISGIQTAVVDSCEGQEEWPARIAAGITAAVDFVATQPGAARALTIDSRVGPPEDSDYGQMIERFAGLLGAGAPRSNHLPASTDRSVVSIIASVISCHVRTGTTEALSEGDPNLVFLALLPYVGFTEASRWSAAA